MVEKFEVDLGGALQLHGAIVQFQRAEYFVDKAQVVAAFLAQAGVSVGGVGDGDAAAEEAGQVGGPDEFFLAFALVGEGEGGVLNFEF